MAPISAVGRRGPHTWPGAGNRTIAPAVRRQRGAAHGHTAPRACSRTMRQPAPRPTASSSHCHARNHPARLGACPERADADCRIGRAATATSRPLEAPPLPLRPGPEKPTPGSRSRSPVARRSPTALVLGNQTSDVHALGAAQRDAVGHTQPPGRQLPAGAHRAGRLAATAPAQLPRGRPPGDSGPAPGQRDGCDHPGRQRTRGAAAHGRSPLQSSGAAPARDQSSCAQRRTSTLATGR
jgi:hypothetical protein